jgi:hypothetical protein
MDGYMIVNQILNETNASRALKAIHKGKGEVTYKEIAALRKALSSTYGSLKSNVKRNGGKAGHRRWDVDQKLRAVEGSMDHHTLHQTNPNLYRNPDNPKYI